ncbi:MAG TPA: hypothetical protein VMZ91_11975 [Candidatus Paceibacterota bacterium]|nr:hypothetical protein [Candidatus Paceibacterota bacterium]
MKIATKGILMMFSILFWMYGFAIFSGSYMPNGIDYTNLIHFFLAELGCMFSVLYLVYYSNEKESPNSMIDLLKSYIMKGER